MKSLITCIISSAFLMAVTPTADARSHRSHGYGSSIHISGYLSCGTPVYTERYVVGYTRCGDPIWGYRRVPAPRVYCPPPRPRCYVPPPPCPPRPCHGGYPRSGVVIQGTFRL